MVDSKLVLFGQTLGYTVYAIVIILPVGGIGMGAFMGMAGLKGMLRRTIYPNGEFEIYMILAALCGGLLVLAFLSFFFNIVMSVGLKGVLGIFGRSALDKDKLLPAQE